MEEWFEGRLAEYKERVLMREEGQAQLEMMLEE